MCPRRSDVCPSPLPAFRWSYWFAVSVCRSSGWVLGSGTSSDARFASAPSRPASPPRSARGALRAEPFIWTPSSPSGFPLSPVLSVWNPTNHCHPSVSLFPSFPSANPKHLPPSFSNFSASHQSQRHPRFRGGASVACETLRPHVPRRSLPLSQKRSPRRWLWLRTRRGPW